MAHLIIIGFKYLSLIIGITVLLRVKLKPSVLWSLIASALTIFLMHLYAMFPLENFGFDHLIFRKVGRDVWAGLDPYAADRFVDHPFLNPPTALPLFALFAVLPARTSLALWTVANVMASLALVPLSLFALKAQAGLDERHDRESADSWRLPLPVIAGLSICLAFSDCSLMGFYVGQLNVFVVLALLASLIAQARGKPVWAGFWLFLGTVKVGTMLPFLLLFLRKADRPTWLTLAVLVLASCFLTGRPVELPGRIVTMVERIEDLSAPGKVNDYSFEGPRNESIIGFEALFYRLGLRDRTTIRNAQYAAVLIVGLCVAWIVVRGSVPRPAACSLVAFFSVIFLYHRDYDTVILVLPLVYSASQTQAARDRHRWLPIAIGIMALAILYLNAFLLAPLAAMTWEWGAWGRLLQAIVLPYATWLIIVAMLTLIVGESRGRSGSRNSASLRP